MRRNGAFADVTTIDIHIAPYDWDFARDQADRIDAHWDRTRAAKPALFDGRVLVTQSLDVEGERISGLCFETSYRAFLSWRDFGFPGAPVMNAFAMPALLSADGAFILGEMSATTANGGQLYFPAGTPEPLDAGPDGRVDFDANIRRELKEETGLDEAEVTLDPLWTAVFAGPRVAFMKIARSTLDVDALQGRLASFNTTQDVPELSCLVPVRSLDYHRSRIPDFMRLYLDRVLSQAG